MSNLEVPEVVVGRVTREDSKEEPQEMALEPVPVIAIHRVWAWTGVPLRPVVKEVISTVWPVMMKKSTASVLIVGVAAEMILPTRFVRLILSHSALVELVAVNTCPVVGGAAAAKSTVVVALFKPEALI